MIDDVDEKIRRNLLIYSSLCLIAKWLDISVAEIATAQFQWLRVPSSNNLVAVAIVVQIYLLLRYRFSKLASRAWREMQVEIIRMIRRFIRADIEYKIGSFKNFQKCTLFKPDLAAYISREQADDIVGDGVPMTIRQLTPYGIRFKNSWSGEFSCASFADRPDGSTAHRSGGYRIEFNYGFWDRMIIWAKASIPIILYTRGSIELVTPVALGLISLAFLCYELLSI